MAKLWYPLWQICDGNGNPLPGAKVYTEISGTSTPSPTYTDATGGSTNTNPVEADINGRVNIWLDNDHEYRIRITTASGTPIGGTLDNQTGLGVSVTGFTSLVGDLSLNSHNIIGTGNINITGNVTATGDLVIDDITTDDVVSDTITANGLVTANAGLVIKNGATTSGFVDLYEDSDNGTSKIRLIANSTLASDKTQTLQDVSGEIYVSTGTDIPITDGGTGASTAAGAVSNLGLSNMSASNQILTLPTNVAGPSEVRFGEDTDNGSNYTTVKAPTSLADNNGSLILPTVAVTMPTALPGSTSTMTISSAGAVSTAALPEWVYLGKLHSGNSGADTSMLTGYKFIRLISRPATSGSGSIIDGGTNDTSLLIQLYINGAYVTTNYANAYYGFDITGAAAISGNSAVTSGFVIVETTSGGVLPKLKAMDCILKISDDQAGPNVYYEFHGNIQARQMLANKQCIFTTFSTGNAAANGVTGLKLVPSSGSLVFNGGHVAVYGLRNAG